MKFQGKSSSIIRTVSASQRCRSWHNSIPAIYCRYSTSKHNIRQARVLQYPRPVRDLSGTPERDRNEVTFPGTVLISWRARFFHLSRRFCSNLSQNPGWIPPQNPVMSPKRNPPQGCLSFRHLTGRTTVLRCFLPTQTAQFCTVQTSLRRTTAYAGR